MPAMVPWKRLAPAAVALAILVPGTARAQSAPEPSTQAVVFIGKPHRVVVPAGWTAAPGEDRVAFTPPKDKLRGEVDCFVIAVAGQFAGNAPKDFAKVVATKQKDQSMPWGTLTDPDDMTFVGLPAGLISVGGVNPETKNQEAMVILVAPTADMAYAFVVKGRTDDIQDISGDLATIINGVQPGAKGDGGSKGGGSGTGCVGFGCQSGPAPSIDDPPWGLDVSGLSNRWRVEAKKGSYVFQAARPETRVTVSHRWKDDPGYKAAMKTAGGKAEESKLKVDGARDARQVRCVMDKNADKTLGKDIPKVVVIVRGHGMHMFLFAKADGLDIPDARVADFLGSLALPH